MNRRIAGLLISGECVARIARTGNRHISVESPVPESAKFFSSYFDYSRNAYVAIFEDDSFDLVPECGAIPILNQPCYVTETQGSEQ